ncbi:MAG TPA: STAS domain-containing protein [Polyangiaceae bacterium]|jgi:rsbT antagonist protein RsbS
MGVPILKQGEYLVVAIQDELTDTGWHDLRTDLVARAGKYRSRGVLIDVSAMEVMDSFATRMLDGIARMLRFRGAETVVAGMQPEVAFAMAQLGLRLPNTGTALDMDDGFIELQRRTRPVTHVR